LKARRVPVSDDERVDHDFAFNLGDPVRDIMDVRGEEKFAVERTGN